MTVEQKIASISGLTEACLAETATDGFLVEVRLRPGNKIQVFLDADNGISLGNCTKINRCLYPKLEESALFEPGDLNWKYHHPDWMSRSNCPASIKRISGDPWR